jgi:hypothetical protein
MTPQRTPKPVQLRNYAEKRWQEIPASWIRDDLGGPRKKKPGTECRAWDVLGMRRCGLTGAPAPDRLFCRNDVRPFVVGLAVSFVLAGREELR